VTNRPFGPANWRAQYLANFRFHLRGYPEEIIEDYARQIDVQIQDVVEDRITDAERTLSEAERIGITRTSGHKAGSAAVEVILEQARFVKETRAIRLLESQVVKEELLPAEELAQLFAKALRRQALANSDSLAIDVLAVIFGALMLHTIAPNGVAPLIVQGAGSLVLCVAVASAILRRLPVGRFSKTVYRLLPWARAGLFLGALGASAPGLAGILADISVSYSRHSWTFGIHLSHVPFEIVAIVCAMLLALQPRSLRRHELALRRYVDLSAYREERFAPYHRAVSQQKYDTNYFTEESSE
jgi:hypothetical protein